MYIGLCVCIYTYIHIYIYTYKLFSTFPPLGSVSVSVYAAISVSLCCFHTIDQDDSSKRRGSGRGGKEGKKAEGKCELASVIFKEKAPVVLASSYMSLF